MKRQAKQPSNVQFTDTIEKYRADLESRGLSRATERFYESMFFGPFAAFCGERGLDDLLEIGADDIRAYLIGVRKRTYFRGGVEHLVSSATVGMYYTALNAFWSWAVREGHVEVTPMARVTRPKATNKPVKAFTRAEAARLIECAGEAQGHHRLRDRAILLTLLGCGLRAGELVGMSWPDVDYQNHFITVFGKTGERKVPLGDKTAKALRLWQARCPKLAGAPVWATQQHTRMGADSLYKLLDRLGEYAGVEGVHPHRFRHTAATEYSREHRDIFATMDFLGHSNLRTTERYLQSLGAGYSLERGYKTPDAWL